MKFVSHYNEAVRVELLAELEKLREERKARAWDGSHTYDSLRFISGWIQALEWILSLPFSDEPAPATKEEAIHWRWETIEAEMQNRPLKTPEQLHDETIAKFPHLKGKWE